jgi:hypothetical protein
MTTKAEDVRAIAEKIRLGKYGLDTLFEAQKLIREYADLLDQQAKGEPVGEVICPMDEGGQRIGIYGEEIDLGTLLYTHPSPAQAEPVSVSDGWVMVPIEPTDAMLSAPYHIWHVEAKGLWKQILSAAPQPGESHE